MTCRGSWVQVPHGPPIDSSPNTFPRFGELKWLEFFLSLYEQSVDSQEISIS